MNDENQYKNNLIETIGIVIFMFVYALLGIHYLPLNLIFFPVGFIYIGIKKGIVQSIVSMLVVSIFIGLTVDILSGALLFVLFIPVSLFIISGIKSRKRPIEILAYSTGIFFISAIFFYGYAQNIAGVSIVSQMEESFKQVLSMQVDIFKETGLTEYEILKAKNLLESGYKYMLWIFPTIIAIISMFISYSNYYLSVVLLRRSGIGIVSIPRFSKFRLPNNIMPGIIVMFLGVYLYKGLNFQHYDTVFLNVIVLIWSMFVIQGLSVIDFYLIKINLKLFLRIILIMLMVIIAPLGTLISLIGLSDVIFDFRRLRKHKS